jgi:hypothetical protein
VGDRESGRIVASKARGGIGYCNNGGRWCHLDGVQDFAVTAYETDALMQTTRLSVRWGRRTADIHFIGGNIAGGALPQTIHPCEGDATLVHSVSRTLDGTGVVSAGGSPRPTTGTARARRFSERR